MGLVVVIAIIIVIGLASWIGGLARQANLYQKLKPRLEGLEVREAQVEVDRETLRHLVDEKTQGFPWLASAWAEHEFLRDSARASYLEFKSHPARKAAQHVREVAQEKRRHHKLWRVLKYKLDYYHTLFPWLVDFTAEDADELLSELLSNKHEEAEEDDAEDRAKHWLAPAEYARLPSEEKYQLALERYWRKRKSKWEIGRDYERYIGYRYEERGYSVHYQGIVEGFADLGRDLIATQEGKAIIVQCKCWSKHRTIHEKHVFQLYGTLLAYRIDHPDVDANAVLVTSTLLSERARQFADMLDIRFREQVLFEDYPSIKCNVSRRDGSRIYHLPFDQQYDSTVVEHDRGECYVATVAEAEKLGFRRAFRWRGDKDPGTEQPAFGPAG